MERKLLDLRKKAKKEKPDFVVKESKFSARVKSRWRFPRGKHSAVRQVHRGRPALVSIGYGSPRAVRGLHSSGLEKVLVHNLQELLTVNPGVQGAVIASTVGKKKKLELLKASQEKKIPVLNVKDVGKLSESIMGEFTARKEAKGKKLQEKSKKVEDKKKKAEDKKKEKKEAKEGSVEEKVQQEKKMVEKTITKRQ